MRGPVESTYKFEDNLPFRKNAYKNDPNAARLFNVVCIQGVNACSRKCRQCPAGSIPSNNLANKMEFISDEVFQKIIADLKSINYTGAIALYFLSEPMLDPKYEEKVAYMRQELGKVKINVYSNGYSLDAARIKRLFDAGVNYLWINSYTEKDEISMISIVDSFKADHGSILSKDEGLINMKHTDKILRFLPIFTRKAPSDSSGHWNNRGGLLEGASFNKLESPLESACTQPFRQIFYDHKGFQRFCCSSWHPQEELGNILDNHILEMWNQKHLHRKRKGLFNKNRNSPECVSCDCKGGAFKGHLVHKEDALSDETVEQANQKLWDVFGGEDYKNRVIVNTDAPNAEAEHEMDFATLVKHERNLRPFTPEEQAHQDKIAQETSESTPSTPASSEPSLVKKASKLSNEKPPMVEVPKPKKRALNIKRKSK